MSTITLSPKIDRELKSLSRSTGVTQEDLLFNALTYYIKSVENKLLLKDELEMWEKISDKDLLGFEKQL
ncbi:hypothetical protein HY061_03355 [Candidatus Azambacteria bacterium]|nr:hypothetical protein [Candidatus Azambacteria bacterium]